jgi:hypothetical protein
VEVAELKDVGFAFPPIAFAPIVPSRSKISGESDVELVLQLQ